MMTTFDPYMQWYEVSSEGVSHSRKVKGPDPDEIFDKKAPPQAYHVYFSTSKQKWMCPCEAYRFSKFQKPCKHIRAVIKHQMHLIN